MYIHKPMKLHVFADENKPYVNRDRLAALIKEAMAPTIFQDTIKQSAVMSLGNRLPDMTTAQESLPILDVLPQAYFLDADEAQKPTTVQAWKNKKLRAAEVAAIVVLGQNAVDDSEYGIIEQIEPRLAEAAGKAFDLAVLYGIGKPDIWPKGIYEQAESAGAVVEATTNLYDDILGIGGVISKVEGSGYSASGHIASIGMKAMLRGLKDTSGRPLFLNDMQSAGNFILAGAPISFPENGGFDASKALMITGNWNQLVYAFRQDIKFDVTNTGNIDNPDGSRAHNLFQEDKIAIRMTMRIGWEIPNPVNGINPTESRFPFAVLKPSQTRAVAVSSTKAKG